MILRWLFDANLSLHKIAVNREMAWTLYNNDDDADVYNENVVVRMLFEATTLKCIAIAKPWCALKNGIVCVWAVNEIVYLVTGWDWNGSVSVL